MTNRPPDHGPGQTTRRPGSATGAGCKPPSGEGQPAGRRREFWSFFFQVLSINGVFPAFRSWEDTINVPAKGQVCIAWLPGDRPGRWMYHCDILDHHVADMMAHFEVTR